MNGEIELHVIPTKYQLADIFTKPLDEPTFTWLKADLGMLDIESDNWWNLFQPDVNSPRSLNKPLF